MCLSLVEHVRMMISGAKVSVKTPLVLRDENFCAWSQSKVISLRPLILLMAASHIAGGKQRRREENSAAVKIACKREMVNKNKAVQEE